MPRALIETVEAIATGRLSPVRAVEESLAAIEAWQPRTTLASQVWAEEALELARALGPTPIGPLHGVPVMVKDLYDVQGHETTGCSRAFAGNVSAGTSPLVYRLRRAGAIVIGKTNQHELAAGATNHVSAVGPARNPWDAERLAGGSSGGSAVAVATGAVPLALGSDTGGSIRIPASYCGATGLKPTHGRLPLHGLMPLAPTMDCPGPMARTALDVTLAFALMDGERPVDVPGSIEGVRVGVARSGLYAERMHPDVRAGVELAGEVLASAGAEIVDGSVEGLEDANAVWDTLAWNEFAAVYPDLDLDAVDPWTRGIYESGRDRPPAELNEARFRRAAVRAAFTRAFETADLLLLPATPFAAPRFDEETVDVGDGRPHATYRGAGAWFTRPVNLAGLPSLVFPAGFDARGLPFGAQLVGRERQEWTILRAGVAFQERTDHHARWPALP